MKTYILKFRGTLNHYVVWSCSVKGAKELLAKHEGITGTGYIQRVRSITQDDMIRAVRLG